MKIPRFTLALACSVAALHLPALPASAELLAYEDFNYPDGPLSRAAGGDGWSAAWHRAPDADAVVVERELRYAQGDVTVDNAGSGRALRTPRQAFETAVSRRFPETGSDIFISFLYRTDTHGAGSWWNQIWISDGRSDVAGNPATIIAADGRIRARCGPEQSLVWGVDTLDGETCFVVMHLRRDGAKYTDLTVYVNPTGRDTPNGLQTSLPIAHLGINQLSSLGLRVNPYGGDEESEVFLGEIRIGTTWAGVFPSAEDR